MGLTRSRVLCIVLIVMNDLLLKTFALALLLGAVFDGDAAASDPREYIARAYSVDTGQMLYTEHHREEWNGGELVGGEVVYRDAEGTVFARKKLSFERGLFAPSFRMIDERDGFEEGADWTSEGLRLFASRGSDGRSKLIEEPPSTAVIDAGFHRFMQSLLPQLRAGESGEFSFAVPSFGRFLRFKVEVVEREPAIRPAGESPELIRLRMIPANALIRLLAEPIELLYDSKGRLLEFRGVTNIPDNEGERHLARIVFDYGSGEAVADTGIAAAG